MSWELDGTDRNLRARRDQKKARKSVDFRVQWKSSTVFQKYLAAEGKLGVSWVTPKRRRTPRKVNQIVSYGEELHG